MSLTFSLQKSATQLSLLFIGVAGSLLGTILPQTAISLPGATGSHALVTDAVLLSADSNTNPGVSEKLGGTGMVIGLAIGTGAVGVALTARKDRKSAVSPNPGLSIEQASRKLQQKLLRLMHDDRDTANRLLAQVKTKNPYKSIDWCVEKVIYDLERDRGGY